MKAHRVGAANDGRGAQVEPARARAGVASRLVTFWCHREHVTTVRLAANVPVPVAWDCAECGAPAGPELGRPPHPRPEPAGRSHLDQLHMRRTPEEGERALADALERLYALRASGEIS
jgi:hypothetical protein